MKNQQDLIFNIIKKDSKAQPPLKPINTLQEIFSVKPVAEEEKQIFLQGCTELLKEHTSDQSFLKRDLDRLVMLSKECMSIQKQGVILLGEKISQAKEIFSSYSLNKPLFSYWIKKTFSSEKTAYNALALFEFYSSIQEESIKEKLKKMPLKASYVLASRKGNIQDKVEIIESKFELNSEEILLAIQSKFPLEKTDHRKGDQSISFILNKMDVLLLKMEMKDQSFSKQDRQKIAQIAKRLNSLVQEESYA
jgi:hypothetical protein